MLHIAHNDALHIALHCITVYFIALNCIDAASERRRVAARRRTPGTIFCRQIVMLVIPIILTTLTIITILITIFIIVIYLRNTGAFL